MSKLSAIQRELIADFTWLLSVWPGAIGFRIRSWWWHRQFQRLGKGPIIGVHLLIIEPKQIEIGDNFSCWRNCTLAACTDGAILIGNRVSLNANVYINACTHGRITIGNDVLIGPNVTMRASDHVITDITRPMNQQGHTGGEIIIDDDVWLAANVTVVGGVHIGRGAVVAAGAVVTRNVEPYTVVGGVPARFIKRRGETQ